MTSASAAVYFISPTQLNVQAPSDDALGSAAVRVTTAQGVSNTVTAETLGDGDAAVVAEIGGVRTPDGVFITVQR